MCSTKEKLEEKAKELLFKVEQIGKPKTGNVGILELIKYARRDYNKTEKQKLFCTRLC